MLACNRDGELPLLFNGGIFTTDNNGRIKGNNNDELPTFEGEPITPDFRRWMGCYFMSQNQRWLGWPTVASGDADLLSPTTRFYRDRAKVAAARAGIHNAEGVVYTEPLNVWGLCPVGPRPDGLCGAPHLIYHFSMGIENAWMNLQAHDTMGIPLDKDLGWIAGTVLFYDSFYRAEMKNRSGKDIVNWLGKQPVWEPLKPRVSLAQGKPIKASSQFIEAGYDVARANDGDLKTRWASDMVASSDPTVTRVDSSGQPQQSPRSAQGSDPT
ncbi:MAG: hypothetical protein WCJ66_14060, partial [Verrucomicrobiota bacterium]